MLLLLTQKLSTKPCVHWRGPKTQVPVIKRLNFKPFMSINYTEGGGIKPQTLWNFLSLTSFPGDLQKIISALSFFGIKIFDVCCLKCDGNMNLLQREKVQQRARHKKTQVHNNFQSRYKDLMLKCRSKQKTFWRDQRLGNNYSLV